MSASRTLLAALAATLVGAAPAHAEPVSAAASDARDGTGGDARDVEQVRSAFDPEAGRWTLTVRLWAPMSEASWAMVNATLAKPGSGGACGASFSTIRGSTRPGAGGGAGSAGTSEDGVQPDGSQGAAMMTVARSVSPDGREVTFEGSHPRLVGRVAACVGIRMSYENETLDIAGARFPVDPDATYEPPSGGSTAAPVRIRIASSRTLRVGRRHVASVWLRAFDQPLTGNARLRAGRSGPILAKAEWRASAGKVVKVRLRLNRAGRRHVRRHRSSVVRLTVGARPPRSALVARTFRVRLVARR